MFRLRIIVALAVVALVAVAALGPAASAAPRGHADIVETAVAAGQFNTLTMLLKRAGLVSTLQKPGPYTVFAPTDAAFKKVPKATLNALLQDKVKLKAVLLYHVLAGKLTATKVVKLRSAKTLNGASVQFRVAGSKVFVNTARVTKTDLMASNGVIHVINRVLIPAA
jgi:uncharacterized surface protein with fasciclin (FAS1) repeats